MMLIGDEPQSHPSYRDNACAPHAAEATYGFWSERNVCSRLQFVQTNISLCFPKVRATG